MSIVEKFRSIRILCIGDVMVDRFILGRVKRISPERPIPVIAIDNSSTVPGGAANVARNIASLGGNCTLIGIIGGDEAGRELEQAFAGMAEVTLRLTRADDRPTTQKTRFVAQGQHLLRADSEYDGPILDADEDAIVAAAKAAIPHHHVVVLSDYAKGVMTDRVVAETILAAQAYGLPIVVDPKSARFERYAGATVVTPNANELHLATGIDPSLGDDSAAAAGFDALARVAVDNILVTRAEQGMTLVNREGGTVHVRASGGREVFDVVGAGDTVVATLSLALGAGANIETAARIANSAAGIVVGKRGTAVVTQTELMEELGTINHVRAASRTRILSWQETKAKVAIWQHDGLRVGFTNGCFDILHAGHSNLLEFARAHCDRLVVALNSDASVRRLKGSARPVNSVENRALLVAAMSAVDATVIFDEDTPRELVEYLSPDMLVKGSDYRADQIAGADFVIKHGGIVLRCELVPGLSTTGVLSRAAAMTDGEEA